MEFVQTKIDYHFADVQLVELALRAAHRDRDDGNADDGCKPRTTSHDCSAVMPNASDYFRA